MSDLGAIMESVHSATDAEQAFAVLDTALQDYGFNSVCFTLITDHSSINKSALHGLASSYPEEWINHYNDNSYHDADPVRQRMLTSSIPFFWKDAVRDHGELLDTNPEALARSNRVMDEAKEAGIADGFGVQFLSKTGELSGLGASRERPEDCNNVRDLADVYLISSAFYERYMSFFVDVHLPSFTKREVEVLSWAAEGKTDGEIAQIVGIQYATVRFHWNNIFKKMQVNSKLLATTTAIRHKVISPERIGFLDVID